MGAAPATVAVAGVRTADAFGPVSPQRLEEGTFPVPAGWVAPSGQPQAEDCHSLNVFTPGTGGSRPVIVWVHGGRWVHDNGAAFGGDPGNMTLLGQSTGSAAVAAILASGRANGLVHRAILQSGVSRARPMAEAAELAERLARYLGVASVRALREVPAEMLVSEQLVAGPPAGLPFIPVVDGGPP